MVDPKNKLRGGKAKKTKVVFGFRKVLRKEKNAKENYFFMFSCLIKNLGCVWLSENNKERKKAKENNLSLIV